MSARQPFDPVNESIPIEELEAAAALGRLARPLTRKAARYCDDLNREGSPEALSRLRVALRRLRSLLWAFEPVLPKGRVERWQDALARASRDAGRARDWDILVDEMLPRCGARDQEGFADLVERLDRRRRDAHRRNRRRLDALDLPALLRDLDLGLDGAGQTAAGKVWRQPLGRFARDRVRKARQALERKAGKARRGTLDDLHEARLALKRLRYLLEFFRPALPDAERGEIGRLSRLQDELGELNDMVVARGYLTKELGKNPPPAARTALAWLDDRIEAEARRSREKLRGYLRVGAAGRAEDGMETGTQGEGTDGGGREPDIRPGDGRSA